MALSPILTGNLNKFRLLSWYDRKLLLQSFLLLPLIHCGLEVFGYYRLRSAMEKIAPLEKAESLYDHGDDQLRRAKAIVRIVLIASNYGLYRASCLRSSMLVWWLTRKEGIQSRICFGIRMIDRQLEAHAWVECDGWVINDLANIRDHYQPLEEGIPQTKRGL